VPADDLLDRPDAAVRRRAVFSEHEPRRPATWGHAGFYLHHYTFSPPPGYRTKILRVYGDVVVWPTRMGQGPAIVPPGTYAGTLWGLSATDATGSTSMSPAADGCFVYLQLATSGKPERAAFDFDLSADGLLGPDNLLESKVAVWLNDTGHRIHIEPTWITVYQFVKEGEI
jgi:hypothetical protein